MHPVCAANESSSATLPTGFLFAGSLVRAQLCCRAQMRTDRRARATQAALLFRAWLTNPCPANETGQLEALLERWQTSLDLHAKYSALDDARYWHVQPWPKHERPQRWIIQLARKRIIALKRLVTQRQSEGDRACIEGIEIMGFLATHGRSHHGRPLHSARHA